MFYINYNRTIHRLNIPVEISYHELIYIYRYLKSVDIENHVTKKVVQNGGAHELRGMCTFGLKHVGGDSV